jgi:ferritin-like metal-binding protein YciE
MDSIAIYKDMIEAALRNGDDRLAAVLDECLFEECGISYF